MTTKEWAQRLNGREYRNELTEEEANQAANDGIIIAFGYSDDLLELVGLVDKEVSAFGGVDFGIVKAIWCPRNEMGEIYASWLIESDLPHEHFDIIEDEELFCRGAVVKAKPQKVSKDFYDKLLNEGFFEIIDPNDSTSYITDGNKTLIKTEAIGHLMKHLTEEGMIKILKILQSEE